ncbi:class 1 isoprenoid biosynthesis enzyme [Segetibacter koreensis]|uniref:class 1 isoprenoid biosynthesis enzyme n=1 Tax=Segetibacter koreensis TaxID=398037 RepID=UPI00037E3E38|nr:class 1 isoprenoid biosynthesis enzyme [Segetibacter koreensis]
MNTFQVLKYGLGLTTDGYRQLAFINNFLKPLVAFHSKKLGYELSASEKKKVLFYYPMYTILGCAEMYTALKGRGLTAEERKRLTLVAAWATLCDDLVDDHNWTEDEVFDIIFNNPTEKGLPGNVKLLIALNNEFHKIWKVSNKYIDQLTVALKWQSESAKQLDPAITLDEIVTICREKNGNTSLMFATLLDEEWTEKELQFIYQSAIVGQLTNDAFDIYKDTKSGIYTYFNKATSIKNVRGFFLEECKKLHSLVRECNAPERNKKNTIRRMSILHAFTLTALDHLQKTEDKFAAPVDWKHVSRQDMVTDMALNSNRFKTVRYMKWLAEQ